MAHVHTPDPPDKPPSPPQQSHNLLRSAICKALVLLAVALSGQPVYAAPDVEQAALSPWTQTGAPIRVVFIDSRVEHPGIGAHRLAQRARTARQSRHRPAKSYCRM